MTKILSSEHSDIFEGDEPSPITNDHKQMGMTFGDGFTQKPVKATRSKVSKRKSGRDILESVSPILPPNKKELAVIYENEQSAPVMPISDPKTNCNSSGEFKKNMLLSFYNWPKIETSSVLQAQKKEQQKFNKFHQQSLADPELSSEKLIAAISDAPTDVMTKKRLIIGQNRKVILQRAKQQ